MRLSSLLDERAIDLNLRGGSREEILNGIVRHLVGVHPELARHRKRIYQKLLERELMEPTALANGAAIPHCKVKEVNRPVVTLSRTPEPVDFGSKEGKPTRLFFTVLSPMQQPALHLKVLAAVAQFLKDGKNVQAVLKAPTVEAVMEWIQQWDLES